MRARRTFQQRAWPVVLLGLLLAPLFPWQIQDASAAAALTIAPITWNITGLDSNAVNTGPNTYPVGARVCNTGATAATNVVSHFVWDSTQVSPAVDYINLTGPTTLSATTLAAGACTDFYYDVVVTRDTNAWNTSRQYHIDASADLVSAVSTPAGRQLYVQKLVSQNRNSVTSINGPSTVYVGQSYQYVVQSSTSTNGYDQLFDFVAFPNVIFRVASVTASYAVPAGFTGDTMYADACGWDNTPTDSSYNSCVGPVPGPFQSSSGKVGGTIVTTYTVQIVGAGSANLSTAILDHSGTSFHYNSDFSASTNAITVTASNGSPSTNTPTATSTSTPSSTATLAPTSTSTPGNTATSGPSNTPTVTPTDTPVSTATPTGVPTATDTFTALPTDTATSTDTPTVPASDTATATATSTASNTPTATNTPTDSPTDTATATATNTPTAADTATATSSPTATATNSPTAADTATATNTSTATDTPTATATATVGRTSTPAGPTAAAPAADLAVRTGADSTSVQAGATASYTTILTNNGPDDAGPTTLRFSLPAHTTFQRLEPPAGWICLAPAIGATGAISCTATNVTAGATASFPLTLNVDANTSAGSVVALAAAVTGTTPDPDTSNNAALASSSVQTVADLSTTFTPPTGPAIAGTGVVVRATVHNGGPGDAVSPALNLTIPPGTTFQDLTVPAGWTCTTPTKGATGAIACTAPLLSAGASVTFPLRVSIASGTPDSQSLTFSGDATTATTDRNIANNVAAVTFPVAVLADMAVTTAISPDRVAPGDRVTIGTTVSNEGPGDAAGVVLAQQVPTGAWFVGLVAPAGWTCTTPRIGASGPVTCTIRALAAGATAHIALIVVVDSTAAVGTRFTAIARVSTHTAETNLGNNSATTGTTIEGLPGKPTVAATPIPTRTTTARPTMPTPSPTVGSNVTLRRDGQRPAAPSAPRRTAAVAAVVSIRDVGIGPRAIRCQALAQLWTTVASSTDARHVFVTFQVRGPNGAVVYTTAVGPLNVRARHALRVATTWATGNACAVPGAYTVVAAVRQGNGPATRAAQRAVAMVGAARRAHHEAPASRMPLPGRLPQTGGGPGTAAPDTRWMLSAALATCLVAAWGLWAAFLRRRFQHHGDPGR